MDNKILYALLLTVLPIGELRAGLPLAILYARENAVPIIFVFLLIVVFNILVIFPLFFFLDKFHAIFMSFSLYRKIFEKNLKRVQKKVDSFEKKYKKYGFFGLALFVGIPLPGTGAWTGTFLSWILGLDRMKSIFSIAFGVLIAGFLVLLGTLGLFRIFDFVN